MKLFITPEARRDIELIGDWIAKDNPKRAFTFVEELEASCAEIVNYPEKYPLVLSFEKRGLRKKVHGNYLIFYRMVQQQIEIIHVLHGAQDYQRFLV
jgi:toxin ParE1/3/4